MQHLTKQITSFLLALVLTLCLLPMTSINANASDEPQATSIDISDVQLIEGHFRELVYPENSGDPWWRYAFEWIAFDFSVTLADDTELKSNSDGYVFYNHQFYRPVIEVEQSAEHPLVVGGTYPAKISIWGTEKDFNITIIENPAVSISTNKSTYELIEGTHAIQEPDGNWSYQLPFFMTGYSVTMKDNSVHYSQKDYNKSLLYKGVFYHFAVTEPEMTDTGFTQQFRLLDLDSEPIDVTIIPSPVKSVEFPPRKIHESDGETFAYTKPDGTPALIVHYPIDEFANEFTVTLKDGTILKSDKEGNVIYKDVTYDSAITTPPNSDYLKPGKNKVAVSIMGTTAYFDLTIVCNNHTYTSKKTQKATATKNGRIVSICECGYEKTATTIRKASGTKLVPSSYVYDGKKKATPKIVVKDSKGKTISSKYYTVSKPKKTLKAIGTYTYTVTFKGPKYTGTKNLTLTIKPSHTTIKTPTPAKKAISVKWTKGKKTQTSGYEILLATNKKFSKNKTTVNVKGYSNTSKKVTKLKAKTTYYMKVRTYKTVSGKKIYSAWSSVKSCKTK